VYTECQLTSVSDILQPFTTNCGTILGFDCVLNKQSCTVNTGQGGFQLLIVNLQYIIKCYIGSGA